MFIIGILTYKNISLIYNPAAGRLKRRAGRLVGRVGQILEAAGHRVTPAPTQGPGTAGEIARRSIESGADLIATLGGDGTMNEALPGVVGSGVPFCVIPAGTANVLSREVGVGCNPIKAAARLADYVPHPVGVGLLRAAGALPRHFLLMAGAGLDAHIVYRLSLSLKAQFGQLAYWTSALKEFGRSLDEFEVQAGGQRFTCSFALASRVRNYAGYLNIARRASLTRGGFELVLFEGRSTLRYYLKYLAAVALRRASNTKGISFLRAPELTLQAPGDSRVYVQVDGEYAGRLPATVEMAPEKLTLLLPPEYLKQS